MWKPFFALGLTAFMGDALYPFTLLLFPFSSRHFDSFRIIFSCLNGVWILLTWCQRLLLGTSWNLIQASSPLCHSTCICWWSFPYQETSFTSFSASSFDSEANHGRDLVLPKSLFPTAETIAVEMLILVHCPAELQNVSLFLKISLCCYIFLSLSLTWSLFQPEQDRGGWRERRKHV